MTVLPPDASLSAAGAPDDGASAIAQPRADAPFFIILNAGSGHEETQTQRDTIEQVLREAGRRFDLTVVDEPGELADIAARAVERARGEGGVVVAAGGDGTINTIARAAVGSTCAFGVLPQGTFNYFGRTHGIPEDLGEATRALLGATIHPVQVGLVNERVFLVNASIGLYPKLLEAREQDKAQFGRSRVVAFLSALKTVMGTVKPLHLVLDIDGKVQKLRTPTLFVGNNRLQMQQVGIAPLSEAIKEGQLAAIAPRTAGTFGMLGLLLRGAFQRLGDAEQLLSFGFRQMTAQRRLSARRHIKVATDGEVCTMRVPLHFSVLEGQLLLLKPAKGAPS